MLKPILLGGTGIVLAELFQIPSTTLWVVMGLLVALDFVTGIAKCIINDVKRTSDGYKKTIKKVVQYLGALVVASLASGLAAEKVGPELQPVIPLLNDAVVGFIIFIEITSIFENLVECDKDSPFSRYFFTPMLKLLTIQLKAKAKVLDNLAGEEPAEPAK